MSESIYKIVDLVGSSKISWEDAAKNAVERASKTLRDLRIAEVVTLDMKIENFWLKKQQLQSRLLILLRTFRWTIEV